MGSAGTVIDTDLLIDLLRNVEESVTFISKLEENYTPLSTTTINAFELYYGAYKSQQRQQNLKATRKLLNRLILLPLDSTSAETAGDIYAELEEKGQPIRPQGLPYSGHNPHQKFPNGHQKRKTPPKNNPLNGHNPSINPPSPRPTPNYTLPHLSMPQPAPSRRCFSERELSKNTPGYPPALPGFRYGVREPKIKLHILLLVSSGKVLSL